MSCTAKNVEIALKSVRTDASLLGNSHRELHHLDVSQAVQEYNLQSQEAMMESQFEVISPSKVLR
jgi:hypothetical protein